MSPTIVQAYLSPEIHCAYWCDIKQPKKQIKTVCFGDNVTVHSEPVFFMRVVQAVST